MLPGWIAKARLLLSAPGKVAEMAGLELHALRFFEREGLFLRDIPRTGGGQWIYAQADVDWLVLCCRFRDSGMPIATIRRFAELVRSGPGNEPDRLALLQEHARDVRARIADLTANLEVLENKVAVYEEHVRESTAAAVWSPMPPQ
ncbi:MerR family transcriptional regulator [Streptomyces sp. NPDC058657]|uniref:MerR family transcriptional regulator n=1 Tax=unclassified Streptomyces TaxID=2593676 RepID=UPI0036548237